MGAHSGKRPSLNGSIYSNFNNINFDTSNLTSSNNNELENSEYFIADPDVSESEMENVN
jgi:hypothetical protein